MQYAGRHDLVVITGLLQQKTYAGRMRDIRNAFERMFASLPLMPMRRQFQRAHHQSGIKFFHTWGWVFFSAAFGSLPLSMINLPPCMPKELPAPKHDSSVSPASA